MPEQMQPMAEAPTAPMMKKPKKKKPITSIDQLREMAKAKMKPSGAY